MWEAIENIIEVALVIVVGVFVGLSLVVVIVSVVKGDYAPEDPLWILATMFGTYVLFGKGLMKR